jgi:hypothetical protein
VTFRWDRSRLFFFLLFASPPASRAASRALARSSASRAWRTRQYSSAGTGGVPPWWRPAASRAATLAW